ncbi:hypothetical protein CEK25_012431 [Fusarium fujikuroi]|nr:hypothetical protein CEK25_012431 [Fusarium fujikuroi]
MSFRVLIAIATRFNYKILQYNAVNAFIQLTLNKDIYIEMPIGYRKPDSKGHLSYSKNTLRKVYYIQDFAEYLARTAVRSKAI